MEYFTNCTGLLPAEGRRCGFKEGAAAGKREKKQADKVEVRFRGSNGDEGRKGAVDDKRQGKGTRVRRMRGSGTAGGAVGDV